MASLEISSSILLPLELSSCVVRGLYRTKKYTTNCLHPMSLSLLSCFFSSQFPSLLLH